MLSLRITNLYQIQFRGLNKVVFISLNETSFFGCCCFYFLKKIFWNSESGFSEIWFKTLLKLSSYRLKMCLWNQFTFFKRGFFSSSKVYFWLSQVWFVFSVWLLHLMSFGFFFFCLFDPNERVGRFWVLFMGFDLRLKALILLQIIWLLFVGQIEICAFLVRNMEKLKLQIKAICNQMKLFWFVLKNQPFNLRNNKTIDKVINALIAIKQK